jgi:hypothetical protein
MLLISMLAPGAALADGPDQDVCFYLTTLHNNDGESQVINASGGLEDFGGAARFKAVVDKLKWEAVHDPWTQRGAKRGVVMISSGDNFLAGPEFNAGPGNGVPFYDTIAMELIGYDAVNSFFCLWGRYVLWAQVLLQNGERSDADNNGSVPG